jgi:CBS domain containing-hemolysin-like protein
VTGAVGDRRPRSGLLGGIALLGRSKPGSDEEIGERGTRARDEVRVRDVSTRQAGRDPAVRAARDRFGGLDVPATMVGTLTALAVLVLLGGLIGAAIGAIGYQAGLEDAAAEISIGSLIGGLIVLFIAFLVGGWAAGRMARYDGARNGLFTAVWALLLAAILSALAAIFGAEYDVFRNVDLPQFFSRDALTLGAIVSSILAIVVMLLGGLLGGKWGERYHRRADATILGTREGGAVTR